MFLYYKTATTTQATLLKMYNTQDNSFIGPASLHTEVYVAADCLSWQNVLLD